MKVFVMNIFGIIGYRLLKVAIFCSMLWVLFSPQAMWAYLCCLFIVPFIVAIPKSIIEVRKERNERFERLFQHP